MALGTGAQAATPWVEGHRGSRSTHPENTLPAFAHALSAGVDVLEMDTAVLKDGTVVVSHDPHVSPKICLASPGIEPGVTLFKDLLWPQVEQIDCGSGPNPFFPKQKRFAGVSPPKLDDVFELVRASGNTQVRFNIETKIHPANPDWTVDAKTFAKQLYSTVERSGFKDRVVIQSFDERTLIEMKNIDPSMTLSFLNASRFVDGCKKSQRLGAKILSPYWALVTRRLVNDCHRRGLQVVPWTANTEQIWEQLIQVGVDGIITDDPTALIQYIKLNK